MSPHPLIAPPPQKTKPNCPQRGNWTAALKLLDRSAQLEPRNRPVLRWKPVIEARRTLVSGRVQRKRMRVHSSE